MIDERYAHEEDNDGYEVVAGNGEVVGHAASIPSDGHVRISIPLDAKSMTQKFMDLLEVLPWAELSFIPNIPVDPDKIEEILANYQAYEARVNDIQHVHSAFNTAFNDARRAAIEARGHYLDELRERIVAMGFEARLPGPQYAEGYKQMENDFLAERRRIREAAESDD